MATTRNINKRNSLSISNSVDIGPSKKSDEGSSQEEDLADPKWAQHVGGVSVLRFSARVVEKQEKLLQKQSHANITPTTSTGLDAHSPVREPNINDLNIRSSKKKRNWTLWSSDDKQYFFEGLNEFGKDFDAIQNYISVKLKSKRSSLITKNKDQVRHFYYRTWNKISKFLTFPDMKKAHQELYGLINYGELRKKQRVLNFKTAVKLSELVQKGSTTIKVRGKTFRIKTPVCRALKKLNQLDEPESKLPNKVTVELIPQNGQAWACVQSLSFNPRVRVHLSLQRSLSSVIKFFEDRWKGIDVKMKEQLLQTFGKHIPRLRFIPQRNNIHHLPNFKVFEATSASKISLRTYADSMLRTERKLIDPGVDDHEIDTEDERVNTTFESPHNQHQHLPSTSDHHQHIFTNTTDEDFMAKWNLSSPKNSAKGWTADEAGMITIGEVYLMLGSYSTLQFEYNWDKYENPMGQSLVSKLLAVTNLLKKKKCYKTKGAVGPTANCPSCGYNSVTPLASSATAAKSGIDSGNISPLLPSNFPLKQPIILNLDGANKSGALPLQFLPTLNIKAGTPPRDRSEETTPPAKSIILLPKGNRRQGRPANKKVIVPRVLPLRPKVDTTATGIFITTTQNVIHPLQLRSSPSSTVVSLKSGDSTVPKTLPTSHRIPTPPSPGLLGSSVTTGSITPSEFSELIRIKQPNINENSNFSLSSFLDTQFSLPASESSNQDADGGGGSCLTTDKFLSCDDNSLLNLLDCKQNSSMEKKPEDHLLSNGPWLSSESNDLSLSSLLGNLESNSMSGPVTSTNTRDLSNGGRDPIVSYLDDDDV